MTTATQNDCRPPYNLEDVLFGGESGCQKNGGNVLLKELVNKYFHEYESSDQKTDLWDAGKKRSKQDISRMILEEIKNGGGRFLKRTMRGTWIEVSQSEALKKIGNGFKNCRRRKLRRAAVEARTKSSLPADAPKHIAAGEAPKDVAPETKQSNMIDPSEHRDKGESQSLPTTGGGSSRDLSLQLSRFSDKSLEEWMDLLTLSSSKKLVPTFNSDKERKFPCGIGSTHGQRKRESPTLAPDCVTFLHQEIAIDCEDETSSLGIESVDNLPQIDAGERGFFLKLRAAARKKFGVRRCLSETEPETETDASFRHGSWLVSWSSATDATPAPSLIPESSRRENRPIPRQEDISVSSEASFESATLQASVECADTATLPTEPHHTVQSQWMSTTFGDKGYYSGIVITATGFPDGCGRMVYDDGRIYEGTWSVGRWHGFGGVKFTNGDTYTGGFTEDRRTRKGKYRWRNGCEYYGDYVEDACHGQGTLMWPDGTCYTGDFERNQQQGCGRYTFADGSYYAGEWNDGKCEGIGERHSLDGRVRKGMFRDGMIQTRSDVGGNKGRCLLEASVTSDDFSGFVGTRNTEGKVAANRGTRDTTVVGANAIELTLGFSTTGDEHRLVQNMKLPDSNGYHGIYTGIVRLSTGFPHGFGRMIYDDWRIYEGSWCHGRWRGFGRVSFPNGDTYSGEHEFDQRHGWGTYRYLDGREYTGKFDHDKRHGLGIFRWPDGDSYFGEFVRGHRDGFGQYAFANGGFYVGGWSQGKYEGHGVFHWSDGRVCKGEWKAGFLRIL